MGRNARNTIIEVSDADSCVMDLNEGNVQAIFDRCLAKDGTPKGKITFSPLISVTKGYRPEDERRIAFDKEAILADKKIILYLYGQLKNTHMASKTLHLMDARITYKDASWTNNTGIVLELLYLGCTEETICVVPLEAKTQSTFLNFSHITPTLSPKDPAFPEWWEQHKAEWEG